jgi:translation initiation factor 2B subunit (eIF-2B alpha/beta/delta family)
MKKDSAAAIEQIREDRLHGAGWLSRRAINVMSDVAVYSRIENTSDLVAHLLQTALQLKKARPDMVSINNYISLFENQLKHLSPQEHTTESLKEYCVKTARKIVNRSHTSTRKAAASAASLIDNCSTIMSYSSTLCKSLYRAHKRGKVFRVIVAESLCGRQAYGRIAASQLKQCNIPTKVINDNEILRYIVRTTLAMIGADCIYGDGSAINGTPSYALADAAYMKGIPLYIICETAKFSPHTVEDRIKSIETGFDYVPAGLIGKIITEKAVLHPRDINYFNSLRG